MRLNALTIKSQHFNKKMRGFDPEEVSEFLEKVADDYEAIVNENTELTKKLSEAELIIMDYKRIEKSLQDTLLTAQDNATKTIEATKKQSALIIKEAELKANQFLENANEECEKIKITIMKLKEERNLLVAKLKTIVNTQVEVLAFHNKAKIEEKPNDNNQIDDSLLDVEDIVEKLL
jgi:cell division initiation protein